MPCGLARVRSMGYCLFSKFWFKNVCPFVPSSFLPSRLPSPVPEKSFFCPVCHVMSCFRETRQWRCCAIVPLCTIACFLWIPKNCIEPTWVIGGATISATDYIGHNHIGHSKTISATAKNHIGHTENQYRPQPYRPKPYRPQKISATKYTPSLFGVIVTIRLGFA